MRSRLRVALAEALAVLAAASSPAQTAVAPAAPSVETLERVVAVVDERPLLLSDVRALGAVRGLDETRALEAAIDERLMYAEASRLAQAEVRPGDEDAALAALLAREPKLADRVAEADLRRLLRRQLTILRYVEFRFRPQLRITDEQVRRAWEAEEVGRPSGVPLEDAQEAIRARLERRALDERVEAWVAELRTRADVRRVAPAAPAVGR
jgi:hypothetical protein